MRKEKIIKVNEREVSVVLRRNKLSRTVRLTVAAGGKITLNMPMVYPEFLALRFLQQKGDWLLRKVDEMEKIKPKISPATERFQYQLYKAKAEKMVKELVLHYNEHYRQDFRRISVKNQKSRWGSCSTIKNLNFNYRVVFYPRNSWLILWFMSFAICKK
jgi:predicted metal-dependent hydrolase